MKTKTVSLLLPVLVSLLLAPVFSRAQNVSAELLRLQNRYAKTEQYSVSMTYKVFKGHTSQTVAELQPGRFEMQGNQRHFVMGNTEILQNSSYLVQIDHEVKEMDVAASKEDSGIPAFGNFTEFEPLLKRHNALFFRKESNGQHLLVFDLKKSGEEYEKVEIRYIPSGEISSITLYYRASAKSYGAEEDYKPRVEIHYRDHNFSARFSADHFSEKKYVLIQNGDAQAQPSFKNYKIFDTL